MNWTRRIDDPGQHAIEFIERRLSHTKGKWSGKPFILLPWQKDDIVRPLFGTLDVGTHLRRYRTAYIGLPRKNGKSEIGAAIALKLMFADGEPGAEIYSAAADREQASIVFHVASAMLQANTVLAARAKVYRTRVIEVPKTGAIYRVLSSDAFTKHGLNAHGIIFDELHAQPNRELWDVLTTSTGSREQPLTLAISTAGFDKNSIWHEIHSYAEEVLSGKRDDPSFFSYIRQAPADADWTDRKVWALANPALGVFRSEDELARMVDRARDNPVLENTVRRLYLNQTTSQEVRWIPYHLWQACASLTPERVAGLDGNECYAGLDLSTRIDVTALVLAFPLDDDCYALLPHFWLPEENLQQRMQETRLPYDLWVARGQLTLTSGNIIDYREIAKKVAELSTKYRIREIGYDRWGSSQISSELEEQGAKVVPIGQGIASMSAPSKDFFNLIVSKKLLHADNGLMNAMIEAVSVTQDNNGNIKPIKTRAGLKIDGVVAAIMALDRAMRRRGRGRQLVQRGMLSV